MLKSKKGSHIEVVLSFIIFIGFLIFLYPILIEPAINIKKDNQYLLDNLEIKLIENISSDLTILSINIDNNSSQNCIRLNNLISDSEINSRIVVKNNPEETQTSYALENDLEIVRNSVEDVFFKIYYSEEFKELDNTGENPCNPENYTVGLVRTNEYVFETKIISLIEEYESNYEKLKERLELPSKNEFDFSFVYNNKTTIGIIKEISTNVYAEEIPVQYVNKDGNILLGNIIIRIW